MEKKSMTSLDVQIERIKSKLEEFLDMQSIQNLVRSSERRAMWAFRMLNVNEDKKSLFEKVVFFYDATVLYSGVYKDNFYRSEKDKTCNFEYEDPLIPNQKNQAEIQFPHEDKFNKEHNGKNYDNPLYCLSETDIKTAKSEAKDKTEIYSDALEYWLKELDNE